MARARRSSLPAGLLLAWLAVSTSLQPAQAARGGRGGGGVRASTTRPSYMPSSFSPSATRPSTSRPSTTTPAAAGAAGAAARPAAAGAAAAGVGGASLGGLAGMRYPQRSGFRSTPFLVPFAVGGLAGASLAALSSNPRAYCNGVSIQCYRQACAQQMAARCPGAEGELALIACPDTRFSECWQSPDQRFQCFGTRRPTHRNSDVAAVCHVPEDAASLSGANSTNGGLSYGGRSAAAAAAPSKALLAGAAGVAAGALVLLA